MNCISLDGNESIWSEEKSLVPLGVLGFDDIKDVLGKSSK